MTATVEYHYPSFRRWVGKQTGAYQVRDATACPLADWSRTKGIREPRPGWATVFEHADPHRTLTVLHEAHGAVLFLDCLDADPMTYEALTKRLDERFTKTGLRRQRPGRRLPYKPTGPLGSFKRGASS
jgi:hypothetical protein